MKYVLAVFLFASSAYAVDCSTVQQPNPDCVPTDGQLHPVTHDNGGNNAAPSDLLPQSINVVSADCRANEEALMDLAERLNEIAIQQSELNQRLRARCGKRCNKVR